MGEKAGKCSYRTAGKARILQTIGQERMKIRTETYNRGFSTTYEYTRKYNANGRRKGGLAMKKIKAMAVGE